MGRLQKHDEDTEQCPLKSKEPGHQRQRPPSCGKALPQPKSPATGPKVWEGGNWRTSQTPTFVMENVYCFITSVALKADRTKLPRGIGLLVFKRK